MRFIGIIYFILVLSLALNGQTEFEFAEREMNVYSTNSRIDIDGVLDETIWQETERHGNFWEQAPEDSKPASMITEVMTTYDEGGLYIAAILQDPNGQVVTTLKGTTLATTMPSPLLSIRSITISMVLLLGSMHLAPRPKFC